MVELARRLARDVTALLEESAPASPVIDPRAEEGPGAPAPAGEGARRLAACATPVAARDWAGDAAGPSQVRRRLHVSRSTPHDWRGRGAVVGLLAGRRKHVFPLALDGRPAPCPADAAAGALRTAWLRLARPHPSLGGRKLLDRLRSGGQAAVVDLARRDFGQS